MIHLFKHIEHPGYIGCIFCGAKGLWLWLPCRPWKSCP